METPNPRITACPHIYRKHVAKGRCGSCATKDWESRNPDHNSGNRWLKNNPEAAKFHGKKNHIKATYGLTLEDHKALFDSQHGKCANPACDFTSPDLYAPMLERLDVDHDHAMGKIRGLLCRHCNQALSRVEDDIDRLRGLIEYLEKHK